MPKKTTKKRLKKVVVKWVTGWSSGIHEIHGAGIIAESVSDLEKILELLNSSSFDAKLCRKAKITRL